MIMLMVSVKAFHWRLRLVTNVRGFLSNRICFIVLSKVNSSLQKRPSQIITKRDTLVTIIIIKIISRVVCY